MGASTLQVVASDGEVEFSEQDTLHWGGAAELIRRDVRPAVTESELAALRRLRAEAAHWQAACREAQARALHQEAQAEGLRSRLQAHEGNSRRAELELRDRVEACKAQLTEREYACAIESAAWSTAVQEAESLRADLRESEQARREIGRERSGLQDALAQRLADWQQLQREIDGLKVELVPLRIKGARYDRILGWMPIPLLRLARKVLGRIRRTPGAPRS